MINFFCFCRTRHWSNHRNCFWRNFWSSTHRYLGLVDVEERILRQWVEWLMRTTAATLRVEIWTITFLLLKLYFDQKPSISFVPSFESNTLLSSSTTERLTSGNWGGFVLDVSMYRQLTTYVHAGYPVWLSSPTIEIVVWHLQVNIPLAKNITNHVFKNGTS